MWYRISKVNNTSLILLISLFVLSPFYLSQNIGGQGLALPINISVWFFAVLFITFACFYSLTNRKVVIHKGFFYCCIFPFVLILCGLFSNLYQPESWFFRQVYILLGFLFVFLIFQLRFNTANIDALLFAICLSGAFHSFVGLVQIYETSYLVELLPSQDNYPVGVFQQKNVQASFLASSVITSLFLLTRPSYKFFGHTKKFIILVSYGLSLYVMLAAASRVGLLGAFLAVFVLVSSRYQYLLRNKLSVLIVILFTLITLTISVDGLSKTKDKTEQMTQSEYATARQVMYSIGLDLIQERPLFGFGIGSFPRVWDEATRNFVEEHPRVAVPQIPSSHPHNEILFWMIEAGLVAVSALSIVCWVILRALFKCGWQRGGGYLSLLIPIALHTMVELPFYLSSFHWFIWLFFVSMIFSHQLKAVHISFSKAFEHTARVFVLIFLIVSMVFLLHSAISQKQIHDFKTKQVNDLSYALNNMYFHDLAEKLFMESFLYQSISDKDKQGVLSFINWAKERSLISPELGIYILLSYAYTVIQDKNNACQSAKSGLMVYNENQKLMRLYDNNCL